MNKKLKEKIFESLAAVLPITCIVLVLSMTIAPLPLPHILLFLGGAVLLIVGMGFFTMGVDMSMSLIGEKMGARLAKSSSVIKVLLACCAIGIIVTIAEPDLQVLAAQCSAWPKQLLIWAVAIGVGVFLALAFLRIFLQWSLSTLLVICYVAVLAMSFFVPADFISVAFDAGGVTTGPVTVPFIMALGVGLAAFRRSSSSESDSFGLVALCSVGPILAVMILGLVFSANSGSYSEMVVPLVEDTRQLAQTFGEQLPHYGKEVLLALSPIIALFILCQILWFKLRKRSMVKIAVGMGYTFIGLSLFLTGVNVGFMPAGNYLGARLAALDMNWIIIPIAMLIGYFIVKAEPAVGVLTHQVEEITGGSISRRTILLGLSVGMALALGLAMLRVLTGLPLRFIIIPGYAIALGLSFIAPKVFTSIAFDSGGVVSGPMTATFLLPFAMGAVSAVGGNILSDAFGLVALVAMSPLIIIQLIGVMYQVKTRRRAKVQAERERLVQQLAESEIIDLREEYSL